MPWHGPQGVGAKDPTPDWVLKSTQGIAVIPMDSLGNSFLSLPLLLLLLHLLPLHGHEEAPVAQILLLALQGRGGTFEEDMLGWVSTMIDTSTSPW